MWVRNKDEIQVEKGRGRREELRHYIYFVYIQMVDVNHLLLIRGV